ncbi:MAG: hypothetical protein R3B84_15105 [Zavarzinella sp.]
MPGWILGAACENEAKHQKNEKNENASHHSPGWRQSVKNWIPAFAGMTISFIDQLRKQMDALFRGNDDQVE